MGNNRSTKRNVADKLLDMARVTETRTSIMMIAYALLEDKGYSKQEAAEALVKLVEPLGIIEQVQGELENEVYSLNMLLDEYRKTIRNERARLHSSSEKNKRPQSLEVG